MQGPAINLVLLSLLVLFFGIQQQSRKRMAFRFWTVGWVLILLSYIVWDLAAPEKQNGLLEAVRSDLLLLGGMIFLFSFNVRPTNLRRPLLFLAAMWLAASGLIDSEILTVPPLWVEVTIIALGEGLAIWAAWQILPRRLRAQRWPLTILCVLFGTGIILTANNGGHLYLQNLVQMQVFESIAVLYAGSSSSGWVVRTAGFLGFASWALGYPLADLLHSQPNMLQLLYQFWDLPKYMAGFAMTLEIFEDTRLEVTNLADEYKTLYEDFHLLYDTHPHPMWIYSPQTRRFLSANRATMSTYGYSEPELLAMTVDQMEAPLLIGPESKERTSLHPRAGKARSIHQHKSGAMVSVEVTEGHFLFQGEPARVVLAVDVTERDKLDQELFRKAHHDSLTGLPNRLLLEDRVHQCLSRSERDDRRAVLLTIDVDHFKQVNDTYGHMAGDECLKAVAMRLQSKIRQVDTIARTGGEEFTAIIGGLTAPEDAEKIAHALLRAFDAPLQLPDCALALTISIGAALYPDDGEDYQTLRKLSDEALYRAKAAGRNCAAMAGSRNELCHMPVAGAPPVASVATRLSEAVPREN